MWLYQEENNGILNVICIIFRFKKEKKKWDKEIFLNIYLKFILLLEYLFC